MRDRFSSLGCRHHTRKTQNFGKILSRRLPAQWLSVATSRGCSRAVADTKNGRGCPAAVLAALVRAAPGLTARKPLSASAPQRLSAR